MIVVKISLLLKLIKQPNIISYKQTLSIQILAIPMLVYCLLEPRKQSAGNFELKYKDFRSWKCI